jgi:hypothetical protein
MVLKNSIYSAAREGIRVERIIPEVFELVSIEPVQSIEGPCPNVTKPINQKAATEVVCSEAVLSRKSSEFYFTNQCGILLLEGFEVLLRIQWKWEAEPDEERINRTP